MKLKAILCLLIVCLSKIVSGQIIYGFKAGPNFTNQYKKIAPPGYPEEKLKTKILTGFHIGAFLEHKLNGEISLATEANFSLLGSKTKYTRTDFIVNPDGTISGATTGYYSDKIYQIEIPLFVRYHVNKFYLGLGPTIGINISSEIDNFQNETFESNYYKPIDFRVAADIGFSISERIGLNLRYSNGLVNIDKREYSTIKNRVLSFSAVYSLK